MYPAVVPELYYFLIQEHFMHVAKTTKIGMIIFILNTYLLRQNCLNSTFHIIDTKVKRCLDTEYLETLVYEAKSSLCPCSLNIRAF